MKHLKIMATTAAIALTGSVLMAAPAIAKQPEGKPPDKGGSQEKECDTGSVKMTETSDGGTRTTVERHQTNASNAAKFVGSVTTKTYEVIVVSEMNVVTNGQCETHSSVMNTTEELTLISSVTCFVNPGRPDGIRCVNN